MELLTKVTTFALEKPTLFRYAFGISKDIGRLSNFYNNLDLFEDYTNANFAKCLTLDDVTTHTGKLLIYFPTIDLYGAYTLSQYHSFPGNHQHSQLIPVDEPQRLTFTCTDAKQSDALRIFIHEFYQLPMIHTGDLITVHVTASKKHAFDGMYNSLYYYIRERNATCAASMKQLPILKVGEEEYRIVPIGKIQYVEKSNNKPAENMGCSTLNKSAALRWIKYNLPNNDGMCDYYNKYVAQQKKEGASYLYLVQFNTLVKAFGYKYKVDEGKRKWIKLRK